MKHSAGMLGSIVQGGCAPWCWVAGPGVREVLQVQLLLRLQTVKEKLVRENIQLGGEGLVTVTLEVIIDGGHWGWDMVAIGHG